MENCKKDNDVKYRIVKGLRSNMENHGLLSNMENMDKYTVSNMEQYVEL